MRGSTHAELPQRLAQCPRMQKVAGSKPQFQMSTLLSSHFDMADVFAAFTTSMVDLPSYQAHRTRTAAATRSTRSMAEAGFGRGASLPCEYIHSALLLHGLCA
jgi:hypothetical protein